MATSNVIELVPDEAASKTGAPRRFEESHAKDMHRAVAEARSICRVVAMAIDAQMDGSVSFDDATVARWGPSIDAASHRLRTVGSILGETVGSPPTCDWWTSLNLLEALGAAMWHCQGPVRSMGLLEESELASFMCVVIESLDELLQECEAVNAMFLVAGRMDH